MEKRIVEAFDQITMPEETVRRIEARLEGRKERPQRYTMVLNRKEKRSWRKWSLAAACMVLLLLVLPHLDIPQIGEEAAPAYSEPVSTEETEVVITQEGLPFWKEGREILDPLCRNMPEWKGYASLEDSFWTELVVRTLNGYAEDEEGNLQTQAGSVTLVGGRIRIDRSILSAYIEKIMGLPLPEFLPCGEYADLLSYEGGAYYAANTVFSDYTYTLKDWKNGSYPQVIYSIHAAPGGEELGIVTFLLAEGEQEGEYIILDKTVSGRRVAKEAPEMEAAALEYAKAYFANDTQAIVNHMTSRSDSALALNQMVINKYTGSYPGGWNETDFKIEDITPYGFPWDTGAPVVYVTYSWNQGSYVGTYAGTYAVVLHMAKTEEGWKVRFSDEEPADSYDPERSEIRSAALYFAWEYANGDVERVRPYMSDDLIDPPVHQCTTPETKYVNVNGAGYTTVDATIDYDPDTPDPVTGELRADVRVEFDTSDQDLDGDVLILHMVKKEDGWKVDHAGEG